MKTIQLQKLAVQRAVCTDLLPSLRVSAHFSTNGSEWRRPDPLGSGMGPYKTQRCRVIHTTTEMAWLKAQKSFPATYAFTEQTSGEFVIRGVDGQKRTGNGHCHGLTEPIFKESVFLGCPAFPLEGGGLTVHRCPRGNGRECLHDGVPC